MSTVTPAPLEHVPTVRGPVSADDLGLTLAHEHLFVLSAEFQSNYPDLWDPEEGVRAAVAQLGRAYEAGVRTIIDMTVLGQGRDLSLVKRVAERTEVNIVIATGVYSVDGLPLFARFRGPDGIAVSEEPLIDLLLRDVTEGVGGSGIRAGVVKFACERVPPDASAHRMAAAVAEVHRRTGVPVLVHSDPFDESGGNGIDLVRILEREGVAPNHVVVGHAGDSASLRYLRELADTGCMLGYDRYGMERLAPDEQRNATLAALVRAGHTRQILLSQDHAVHIDYFTVEQRRHLFPQWSYTHLLERALPRLRAEQDIDESAIDIMLVDNPRRLLTRQGAPAPARTGEMADVRRA
ncbi:phosphotriesterase [Sphaerisporangium melleum]|nr:phosphotriesterase [Sphaerisporangium melleum]